MTSGRFLVVVGAFALILGACGSQGGGTSTGSGGTTGTGGSSSSGGTSGTGTGGSSNSGTGGGVSGSGGGLGSGGSTSTGGAGAGTGGATGSGGVTGSGGKAGTSGSGGGSGTAGSAGTGGGAGAHGSGGASGSGGGIGGAGATGSGGAGGSAGTTGSAGNGGAGVRSAGCDNAQGPKTITTGGASVSGGLSTSTRLTIKSGGSNRDYIIDIPANYDATHAYRLIFAFHWIGSSDTDMATGHQPANSANNFNATNYSYYGLRREANNANDPAIFIAPSATGGTWNFTNDGPLFDDLLNLANTNLCIDTSRVFATGFSFGAMMSYALSITRQKQLRAVVAMAAANYNLPAEPTDSNAGPIAYMGTVGMNDTTCPYVNSDSAKTGGKYCALTHAQDNGCTIPTTIPTTTSGSKTYVCYDFQGCKTGYPVRMCTFDGIHQPAPVDDGSSTLDDGLKSWIPPMAWKFFTQF